MADIHADDQVPPPSWPTCTHQTGESGSPCNGRQVDGFDRCLAHLEPEQLEHVLQRFSPGADLEAPGTSINAALLERILSAVAGTDGPPRFGIVNLAQARFIEAASFASAQFSGKAEFGRAQFSGKAEFGRAQFSGKAEFRGARFSGDAGFGGAQFSGDAVFYRARFSGGAGFGHAQFSGDAEFDGAQFRYAGFDGAQFGGDAEFRRAQFSQRAWFGGAQFSGDAAFSGAQFGGDAVFYRAQFSEYAGFHGAQFSGDARFSDAKFEKATSLGPLTAGNLILLGTVFVRPIVFEAAAVSVTCADTTWEAGVTMRLRYATVDLERATFTVPSFIAGADQEFKIPDFGRLDNSKIVSIDESKFVSLDESKIVSRVRRKGAAPDDSWVPVVSSLRGADASNLSVTDVDLSQCRFAGARLLDQLRLEGRCIFDDPPKRLRTGWAWLPLWRWSKRQGLAEERLWRRTTLKHSGWGPKAETAEVGPERLAGLYRQLRKAQEDTKNEPGAADFYYGEMEMRRHAPTTPTAEHAIIWLYWLISGYGLRALRSLAALGIVGVVATVALIGWGLAATAPPQHLTGTVTTRPQNPARIDATLGTTGTRLPPGSQRWTSQRTRTAAQVTLESIVFRSTAQPLTVVGNWITIAVRILGPVLLALTLLAVRNRVKR